MWLNFHTHSNFCDGKSTLEETVAKAKSLKMKGLGFSSHAPLPFACSWSMKPERLNEYLNKIITLKNSQTDLQVYSGLEVDYVPKIAGPEKFSSELDYTIGSVHFVESFNDGKGWEIDGPHSFFLEGLEKIFSNNIKDVIFSKLVSSSISISTSELLSSSEKSE